MRGEKFKKKVQVETVSVNVTHSRTPQVSSNVDASTPNPGNTVPNPNSDLSKKNPNSDGNNFGNNFTGGYRGNRGGRGRGRFGNVQCQVCFKFDHLANMCYHRFNQQFQAQILADYQGFSPQLNTFASLAPNPYTYGYPPQLY